jgi:hypothetical protein
LKFKIIEERFELTTSYNEYYEEELNLKVDKTRKSPFKRTTSVKIEESFYFTS